MTRRSPYNARLRRVLLCTWVAACILLPAQELELADTPPWMWDGAFTVQVVRRTVDLPWGTDDIRDLSEPAQPRWLAAYLDEDRGRGAIV